MNFSGRAKLGLFDKTADESWTFPSLELNENTFIVDAVPVKTTKIRNGPIFSLDKRWYYVFV